MRLKYIRLAGFKSFVDNTKVAFPEQMTCIVGPNGCGKSNVIDAVRWVLGESSAKNLRGDAMIDVIFNGSQARKPVGQASVELVFDNQDHRLQGEFADFDEVSVKRVVTRDAQSLYFLNNAKCRRRDITDLFLGTGLGPRSYAIIEQGMISRLIESKPQELRVFIEEAAGISKYKERRKETESRIGRTRENLERLTDVREELGQQLAKLQRQASAAKRYQTLKAEERTFKSQLQALKWLHYQQQCDRVERDLQAEETELEKWLAEQRGSERGQTEFRQKELDLQEQVDQVQEKFYQASSQVTSVEQQIRHQRQLAQEKRKQQEEISQQIKFAKEELASEQEQLATLDSVISDVEETLAQQQEVYEERLIHQEQAQERLNAWNEKWQQLQADVRQVEQDISLAQAQLNANQQMLQQQQARFDTVVSELELLKTEAPASPKALEEELTELAKDEEKQKELLHAKKELQKAIKEQIAEQREANDHQQEVLHTLQGQQASYKQLIQSQEVELDNFSKGWLEENGVVGTVSEYLEVPEQWRQAVELWCQSALSAPVISGAVTDVPNQFKGLFFTLPAQRNVELPALAARLSGKMTSSSLFNGIAAAESWAEAQELLLNSEWRAVALPDGRVVGKDFLLSQTGEQDSVLAWQSALSDVEENLKTTQAEITQNKARLTELEQQLAQSDIDIDQQQESLANAQRAATEARERFNYAASALERHEKQVRKLADEKVVLEESIALLVAEQEEGQMKMLGLEEQLEAARPTMNEHETSGLTVKANAESSSQAVADAQSQLHTIQLSEQEKKSQLVHAQKHIQRLEKTLLELSERQGSQVDDESYEFEIQLLEEQLAEHLMQRESAETELVTVKEQLSAIQEELSVLNKGQSAVHERIAAQREKVESRKLELAASRERGHALLESFSEEQVSLKEVLENMPEEANETEWQKALDERARKIQQLGAINLAAIDEVEAQSERKEYLDNQYEDLSSSLETLEDAIKKIDRETRSRFKKTYDQVNADLQALFPKVFGGGSAYLDLTEDDLLETGVTIMARPPGKKNSTIHLLSGGEKALTALALVFAIFRLNPAPFCLLDEVDAPLDDVNVGRFCRLVQEMSESVQFIYISHNKIAMEMATHLAGVTMQEPGVSRLVAVDVDEAVALAEAS
ncbi:MULTISPECIES: chromosome segregation protein SMC [Gammaproteobacteria]|uniref:chromosome segregation protein SMC n=1 Tax=Gammaproteobacteria TaxID=1236 RepID=UPI000DCF89D7|nr:MULTISPECIES: chromosome segregation protein SMC [Gammaproteobacteria]RTE87528.1 chromosome segregation protein SMC [Aliidiomarina sp. B3213]TCZ92687.1 chromosome segregation protein SMC [Lysobacter sp. N42]